MVKPEWADGSGRVRPPLKVMADKQIKMNLFPLCQMGVSQFWVPVAFCHSCSEFSTSTVPRLACLKKGGWKPLLPTSPG